MTTPHIRSGLAGDGRARVEIDSTELYDYVEDLLVEDRELECLGVRSREERGHPPSYTMIFDGGLLSRIRAAIATIDTADAHAIYLINHREPPARER